MSGGPRALGRALDSALPRRHATVVRWRGTGTLALATGAAFAAWLLAADGGPARAQEGDRPACVEAEAIARWAASAYNHWVRVDNRCERAVRCDVSSSVNPEPQRVTVAAGEQTEVMTYRGSPAREFTARVSCMLE